MANAVKKLKLSASSKGLGILIAATATPGTPVHVTSNDATKDDEVWLWLENEDTADILATVEFGGVTSPSMTIKVNVPFKQGLFLAVPGFLLSDGGAGALTVAVFAATTNKITAYGYVMRITP
jgi:hypothetical protein